MFDMSLDCMCKNNSPECPECWAVMPEHLSRHVKGQAKLPFSTSPFDPKVMAAVEAMTKFVEPPARTAFQNDVRYRFEECEELLLRKHKAYGSSNIESSPGGPLNGLQVRMHDKLARITNLLDTGVDPSDESLRDSFVDLANYSLIGVMCIDKVWK